MNIVPGCICSGIQTSRRFSSASMPASFIPWLTNVEWLREALRRTIVPVDACLADSGYSANFCTTYGAKNNPSSASVNHRFSTGENHRRYISRQRLFCRIERPVHLAVAQDGLHILPRLGVRNRLDEHRDVLVLAA